jgi:hypothetical protein
MNNNIKRIGAHIVRESTDRETDGVAASEPKRHLFHVSGRGGGIDLARLAEQLIPSLIIGCVIVFANFKVTESQVGDLKMQQLETAHQLFLQQSQAAQQSDKLTG